MPKTTMPKANRTIRAWLLLICLLIAAMVVVGGATRLTHSGLSITEWKPIMGALPPLSEADWQEAFVKYQQIPEARTVNSGMTLEGFKGLYWWEWSHRLLGRVIGVAFLVPLAVFWLKGWLDRGTWMRLLSLFVLGGLQGAVGWYMVASGLVDRVDVSQYRLALHLGLAVLLFALTLWMLLDLKRRGDPGLLPAPARPLAGSLVGLVFLQMLLGAFVAGLDAGLSHNTWPLMDGAFVPDGLLVMSPWWLNAFENALTVQFDHRMFAYAVAVVSVINAMVLARGPASRELKRSGLLVLAAVAIQIALGVLTLLAAVPIGLAIAHQAGALVVLGMAVSHWHLVSRPGVAAAGAQDLLRQRATSR